MVESKMPDVISSDIYTLDQTIVDPHTSTRVHSSIPGEIAKLLNSGNIHLYNIATRSRVAQPGLEVGPFSTSMNVIEQTLKPLHGGKRYTPHHPMYAEVEVMNHSERPIHIPGDIAIFRFIRKSSKSLKGAQLISALDSGRIVITGDYNKDWKFSYRNGSRKTEDISGIHFSLDPNSHKWLPPSADPTPFNLGEVVNLASSQYRKYIDSFLEPIPVSSQPILTISETLSHLTLNGVHALIYPLVKNSSGEYGTAIHINSLFVENGSNWRIRTEIRGATTPNQTPGGVTMHFWYAGTK